MTFKSLSEAQIRALLSQAKAVRERDWLMILVAFAHGLRASEVIRLKADDVSDGYLIVQRLKRSKKTTQALIEHSDELLNERRGLESFILNMHANQVLFPVHRATFWRIVQRHGIAAGIPKHLCHPHILKHSIAMYLIGKIEINELQQHLGHVSLQSTGEYLKVSDEQASAAVRGAFGHLD